jgi:thiol-disulfide isomerase/thioredoxin
MSKIYYFSAPWCNPCKALGPTMERSGLPFQKVNVDEDQNLSSKYSLRAKLVLSLNTPDALVVIIEAP